MIDDNDREDPVQLAIGQEPGAQPTRSGRLRPDVPGDGGPQSSVRPFSSKAVERSLDPARAAPPDAVEALFREHHRRIFQAAHRITGSAADAEDVLQTVFVRLLRSTAASAPLPSSYFHLAAVNGALDVVRARARTRATPLEDLDSQAAHPGRVRDAAGDVGDRSGGPYQSAELRDRLRKGLAKLKPRAAEVFVLRYLEGYSNKEIARMLGRPRALIAVTLHRARRRLREEIHRPAGGSR